MKEIPMLFSTEMVLAILSDRKTCTRRPLKFQDGWQPDGTSFDLQAYFDRYPKRPYEYGDRIYVRETWRVVGWDIDNAAMKIEYFADGHISDWIDFSEQSEWFNEKVKSLTDFLDKKGFRPNSEGLYTWIGNPFPWRPGIHLPKKASRLWLKVLDVREQQLQDMSDVDAEAEGVERFRPVPGDGAPVTVWKDYGMGTFHFLRPLHSFFSLWNSIYGPQNHLHNPLVYAISFAKIYQKNDH